MFAVVRPWRKWEASWPWMEMRRRDLRFVKPDGGGGDGSDRGFDGGAGGGDVGRVERKRRTRQRPQMVCCGLRANILDQSKILIIVYR